MFLWHHLQTVSSPILIYGMGNGAEKILSEAELYHVPIAGVFASDDHAREIAFRGYRVLSLRQMLDTYEEAVILVGFGVYQEEVISRIYSLSEKYTVFVPDVPLMGGKILTPEIVDNRNAEITAARGLLSDEKSLRVFDAMLEAKLSGALPAYFAEDTLRNEDMQLLKLSNHEHFLDLGAYNGDTINEFILLTGGSYTAIDAFEPDRHNYRKLSEATLHINNLTLHSKASWNTETTLTFSGKGGRNCAMKPELPGQYKHLHQVEAIPVDSLQKPFTYVKMDVEGAEAQTLEGMVKLLSRYHPKLLISCYHKPDDFITLPLLLDKLCPGYRMFMRRNRCLPAWEIQLYCIYDEITKDS